MNNDNLKYGVAGLLIGGAVVWLLTISAVNSYNTGMMQMMGLRTNTIQNQTLNSSTMDAHFIEQMIPHHEDAITMANLAQDKATHQEIKTLAQSIIDAQTKEINQMKQWYKDWYGRDLPIGNQVMRTHGMTSESMMHMGMMGDETDIESLRNAQDFDKAFIEEMIPHHQMAVMMASMLKNGTNRPEMRQLAENIIDTQTKEIDEMRNWHQAWYQ